GWVRAGPGSSPHHTFDDVRRTRNGRSVRAVPDVVQFDADRRCLKEKCVTLRALTYALGLIAIIPDREDQTGGPPWPHSSYTTGRAWRCPVDRDEWRSRAHRRRSARYTEGSRRYRPRAARCSATPSDPARSGNARDDGQERHECA